jgi:hypothetical protein
VPPLPALRGPRARGGAGSGRAPKLVKERRA